MTEDRFQPLIDELNDLLERERTALVEGNLEMIRALLEKKGAVITHLGKLENGSHPEIKALRRKIARNQVLLDHALKGIRAVAVRIGSLGQARKGLNTYDQEGHKQVLEVEADHRVERLA